MATGEEIRKFWAQTHAALSKVDMDAKVEPVESSDPLVIEGGIKTRTAYRVIMSSFEGRRIRAWYTVPSGHPPARGWPAILEGAHLQVRGQGQSEQCLKASVDPGEPEMHKVVETVLTPPHPDPFEALLDEPLTGTFDHPRAQRQPQFLVHGIVNVLPMPLQIRIHRRQSGPRRVGQPLHVQGVGQVGQDPVGIA